MYYRAPGGAFTPYSRKLAASRGTRPLGWNVDSKDFERPGTDTIVATVERELPNGPTILFHDAGGDRAQTVEAHEDIGRGRVRGLLRPGGAWAQATERRQQ